jgi:hypothetical protein
MRRWKCKEDRVGAVMVLAILQYNTYLVRNLTLLASSRWMVMWRG